MTDTATSIALAPLIDAAAPYAIAIGLAVIGWGVNQGVAFLKAKFGIDIKQSYVDELTAAADTEAHILVAGAEGNLANAAIDVKNPLIAGAANAIIANVSHDAADALGLTPDKAAKEVVAAIGRAQIAMTRASAPVPAPKA